jgi:hypothetical protein
MQKTKTYEKRRKETKPQPCVRCNTRDIPGNVGIACARDYCMMDANLWKYENIL